MHQTGETRGFFAQNGATFPLTGRLVFKDLTAVNFTISRDSVEFCVTSCNCATRPEATKSNVLSIVSAYRPGDIPAPLGRSK